jgi:hypothetical protein
MITLNYPISAYHKNEFSSVSTLHGFKLCSKSRTSDQYFVSLYRAYSASTSNILMFMYECRILYKGERL